MLLFNSTFPSNCTLLDVLGTRHKLEYTWIQIWSMNLLCSISNLFYYYLWPRKCNVTYIRLSLISFNLEYNWIQICNLHRESLQGCYLQTTSSFWCIHIANSWDVRLYDTCVTSSRSLRSSFKFHCSTSKGIFNRKKGYSTLCGVLSHEK